MRATFPFPVLLFALALSCPASAADAPDPNDGLDGESRILWVIPNFRTVEESEHKIVPLPTRDKFALAARDSFDPYAFPVAGFYAGIAQARGEYEEWGRGPVGYGKRFAGAFADQTISNYMTEAVFPTFLHEDPRYFRLGRGGFWHRTGYAVSRVFVVRTDRGEHEFNYSEFGGNAVMAVTANAYYPRDDRTAGGTAARWGIQIGLDMVFNVAKEFWPDIRKSLTGS